jgi:hypothetical protein
MRLNAKAIVRISRPVISKAEMLEEGFVLDREEVDSDENTLSWYKHPKINGYSFLIRDDRPGIMISKDGKGILFTVNSAKAIFSVFKNFIQ